ncbi:MAG TPA: VOC family protein [Xanthomonadaceae bacterium]|nr:VOC family protein [Xanthomonadaceae bacterium]
MTIQPYLHFNGNCEEAFTFYRDALGAEMDMQMRYRESPDPVPPECMPPGWEDKVMHSALRIGDTLLMGCDDGTGQSERFQGFALSLTAADAEMARKRFDALAEGGSVLMPLGPTFFSPCFGMTRDRFGVSWMVLVEP